MLEKGYIQLLDFKAVMLQLNPLFVGFNFAATIRVSILMFLLEVSSANYLGFQVLNYCMADRKSVV